MSQGTGAPTAASVETELRAFVAELRDPNSKLRTDRAVAEALEAIIDRHFNPLGDSDENEGFLSIGDRVRFTGCSPEQIRWGGNADPLKAGVHIGAAGIVERVEVHSWHTKIWVRFSNGGDDALLGPYNSICFEPAVD